MPAQPHSIFISYARSDGRAIAGELRNGLAAAGFRLWQDVVDMAAGENWWLQITAAIEGSAVMLLVLTEAALSSKVIQDELAHARRTGTHTIPVVRDPDLLLRAPKWITKLDIVILNERHPDYELSRQRLHRQLYDPPPRRPRPFSAPNLPANFVDRPREFDTLAGRLLGPERRNPVAITTALQGGGGFGKTTLAIALCHDPRIREAFDDGILWVQFRPQSTLADAVVLLNDQIALLEPEGVRFNDLTQASARFRQLLAKRDMLVVLDDVWSETLLPYFLNQGTAYVITTRREPIVAGAAAASVVVDELQPQEAAALLARWIGKELVPGEASLLRELAAVLGEWALLLELAGAELRSLMSSGRSLSEAVTYVRRRLDRRGFTYLDRHDEANRNAAIGQSLNASLDLLPTDRRQRFQELAILSEDANLPFDTVAQLWAATAGYDDLAAEDALEAMHRLALFTRYDASAKELRIHDVVRRVVASGQTDATVLHGKLVDYWGDLHRLPDNYAWRNLMYHLRMAGRSEMARTLLFDLDWMRAKLHATDPVALVSDFAGWEDADCSLMAGALTMAGGAIADPAQLPAQLIGRLERLAGESHPVRLLLDRAVRDDEVPALLPLQVRLPSVDQGIHSTIQTPAPILSAALTPDGTSLILGLANGAVHLCDWRKQELGPPIACGVGPVFSMQVEGDLLAVGGYRDHHNQFPGQDAPAVVWNWKTREFVRWLPTDLPGVAEGYSVTFPASRLLAVTTGEMNNFIHVYDWVNGQLIRVLDGDEGHTGGSGNRPGIVAPAGPYLLYHVDSGRRIVVWNLRDFTLLGRISGQIGNAAVPFVAHDGFLVIRSKWTRRTPGEGPFFHPPEDDDDNTPAVACRYYDPPAFAVARDQERLLVCSDVIEVRDGTGELRERLEGHSASISSLHLAGDAILTTSYDRTVRVWDRRAAPRQERTDPTRFYGPPIACLAVEGEGLFTGNEYGRIAEWHFRDASLIQEVFVREPVRCLAANEEWLVFSVFVSVKRGSFLRRRRARWSEEAVGGEWRAHGHFDARGEEIVFDDHAVVGASLNRDSCAMIVQAYYTPKNSLGGRGYTGNLVYVVNLETLETEWAGGEWASAVALTDEMLVIGDAKGSIEIRRRKSGELVQRLDTQAGGITDLAVHEGHLFASAAGNMVRIWSWDAFAEVRTIPHPAGVNAIDLRGSTLATVSNDHTLRLFDWRTGDLLARFTDDAPLLGCAIADDGATVAAGGRSGQLHVLRANGALRSRMAGAVRRAAE